MFDIDVMSDWQILDVIKDYDIGRLTGICLSIDKSISVKIGDMILHF